MSRAVNLANQLNLSDEQRTKMQKLNKDFAERVQLSFDKVEGYMGAAWQAVEQARNSGDETVIKSAEENYYNLSLQRKTMVMEVERNYLDSSTKYLSSRQYVQLARKLGIAVEGMGEGSDFPPGYKLPD
jgi:hypothetical protein